MDPLDKLSEARRLALEALAEIQRWHDTDVRYIARLVAIRSYIDLLESRLAPQPPIAAPVETAAVPAPPQPPAPSPTGKGSKSRN